MTLRAIARSARPWRGTLTAAALGMALLTPLLSSAEPGGAKKPEQMSFVFRDTPIGELFEMISRKERVNILLGKTVTGNVTVNLYDLTVRQAIAAIADAGGYTVSVRGNTYLIGDAKEASPAEAIVNMQVRAMKVEYSDPKQVAEILAKYSSKGGKITLLEQRRSLIVEDTAEGLQRIASVLREIDAQPQQIMIEAKILEITLDNNQNFGIDWSKIFSADGVNRIGTTGLATRTTPGLFFNLINRNVEVYLNALSNKGLVHTLATPKLLTLENQEASTNIGDKLGYRLTTTINNITTESIQFLETGVILRVTPSVDAAGRIVMKIRPEVSSGSISGGIPSKKTTEVTTQMVAEDGQGILIAGLIKNSSGYRRVGVPVLGDLPVLGRVFSSSEQTGASTETVVLITPRIVGTRSGAAEEVSVRKVQGAEDRLLKMTGELTGVLEGLSAPRADVP